MLPSSTFDHATLIVKADDPATQIQILDGTHQPIDQELRLGTASKSVPGGIYRVRFRSGRRFADQLVSIQAGQSRTVRQSHIIQFHSAAPLPGSIEFDSDQFTAAADLANSAAQNIGFEKCDSELMVFIRELNGDQNADPARFLSLHQVDGDQICRISNVGTRDPVHGWRGALLSLPSSAYCFRVKEEDGRYRERVITTHPGWQTQAYFATTDQLVDLRDLACLLIPNDCREIDLNDPRWQLAEKTLRAVEQPELVATLDTLNLLTEEAEKNPMLGIYAAHLYFRSPNANIAPLIRLLETQLNEGVQFTLRDLPDRRALLAALTLKQSNTKTSFPVFSEPLEVPPLLSESWKLLVQACKQPSVRISEKSLLGRIWRISCTGTGLVWGEGQTTPESRENITISGEAEEAVTFERFSRELKFLFNELGDSSKLPVRIENARPTLTSLEEIILRTIFPNVDPEMQEFLQGIPWARDFANRLSEVSSPDRLYDQVNLPLQTISRAMQGIIEKLQLPVWILLLGKLVETKELQKVLRGPHSACQKVIPFDDFFQEVIKHALKSSKPFQGKSSRHLISWLRGIGCNVMKQQLEQSRRSRLLPLAPEYVRVPGESTDPIKAAESREGLEELTAMLSKISEQERRWLFARFVDKQPWADIAKSEGIAANTLRMRVRRLTERLSSDSSGEGRDS